MKFMVLEQSKSSDLIYRKEREMFHIKGGSIDPQNNFV